MEQVRVRVTETAATRLVREFGAYTTLLDGQFSHERADSVSVSVLIGRAYQGVSLESMRQTLFLARHELVEVRRRQLSRVRTAVASAAVMGAFALLVKSVVQEGDPNDNTEPPPPPPPGGVRATLRIPFR